MTGRRIALLIDGGFFLKRLPSLVKPEHRDSPERIAITLRHLCRNHVKMLTGVTGRDWVEPVYRTFYYDSMPYDGVAHHPVLNRQIDFAKSDVAKDRLALFDCLRRQRKPALRLGKVNREHDWAIAPSLTKRLLRNRQALQALAALPSPTAAKESITPDLVLTPAQVQELVALRDLWLSLDAGSVALGLKQKGVDMRIGVDIASLALKKHVNTIVLVAGDSDFVPAAKLARREGVDFILDPLWQKINADLFEHIDGLQSGLARPGAANRTTETATAATEETEQPNGP